MSSVGETYSPLLHSVQQKDGLVFGASKLAGVGLLVGLAFAGKLLLKHRKRLRRASTELSRQASIREFHDTWIGTWLRWPAFLAVCRIISVLLTRFGHWCIRQSPNWKLNSDGTRRAARRLVVALRVLASGFIAQSLFPILSWNWALYALVRSLGSLLRALVPERLQVDTWKWYGLVHLMIPYFLVWNTKYALFEYIKFFKELFSCNEHAYRKVFCDSNQNPDCVQLPHCNGQDQDPPETVRSLMYHPSDHSCHRAFWKDLVSRSLTVGRFYLKFYVITLPFGGMRKLRQLRAAPVEFARSLMEKVVRSTAFMTLVFHLGDRASCLYRWLVRKYWDDWKQERPPGGEYPDNAKWFQLAVSAVSGSLLMRLEDTHKHVLIAQFAIWKVVENCITMSQRIKTFSKPEPDSFLHESKRAFPAILFATAVALNTYAYTTNPKALGAVEKLVVQNIFDI